MAAQLEFEVNVNFISGEKKLPSLGKVFRVYL